MLADPASRRALDAWLPRFITGALVIYAVTRSLAALGGVNINDDMYVSSASLFPHFSLYSEIAYVQTPLNIYVYSILNFLFGPAHLFLAARLLSVGLVLGAAFVAALTAFRLFPRAYVFQVAFALLLCNPHIYSGMRETGNYALPLFFLAAACHFHFSRERKTSYALLIGLLIGLAATSKINFVTFAAVFAFFYVLEAKARTFMAPYLTGLAIGLLPTAYYFLRDPVSFLFLNIEFHLLTNEHRNLSAVGQFKSVLSGVKRFTLYAAPLVALLVAAEFSVRRETMQRWIVAVAPRRMQILQVAILFAAAAFAAIQPMIYYIQYWNAAALILIMFAVPFAAAIADEKPAFRVAVAGGLSLLLVVVMIFDMRAVVKEIGEDSYAPVLVSNTHAEMAKAVTTALEQHPGCVTEILSASGVAAIGAGLPLSLGSADGSFMFRIDDELRRANSPYRKFSDVGNYMTPHTALLTGLHRRSAKGGDYEERMEAYAIENNFVLAGRFRYVKSELLLFLPPGCRIAPG